jgi:hypothetical protein
VWNVIIEVNLKPFYKARRTWAQSTCLYGHQFQDSRREAHNQIWICCSHDRKVRTRSPYSSYSYKNYLDSSITRCALGSIIFLYLIIRWHLGYCKDEVTPTYRGFNSFYGFYGGSENYYTYRSGQYQNE